MFIWGFSILNAGAALEQGKAESECPALRGRHSARIQTACLSGESAFQHGPAEEKPSQAAQEKSRELPGFTQDFCKKSAAPRGRRSLAQSMDVGCSQHTHAPQTAAEAEPPKGALAPGSSAFELRQLGSAEASRYRGQLHLFIPVGPADCSLNEPQPGQGEQRSRFTRLEPREESKGDAVMAVL